MSKVHIIGAGLAGLSAAITLAEQGVSCDLISVQPSERAQSVLAEGGINAALNTMGENDTVQEHFSDTMRGGANLADPEAVRDLTAHAPEIVTRLKELGVPFHKKDGRLVLRSFGGQKKKRTAYAKSSTGKVLVSALIDEARKWEAAGLIQRLSHHEFIRLLTENGQCCGVRIWDTYTGGLYDLGGAVILASGGLNGLFPGRTTGTTANTGDVTATAFRQGVRLSNLEMIQFHPTTYAIAGKRCLLSEAARGEGGRLFIRRNGEKWYFMEEKYPELKNLMPRDVVTREMYFAVRREDTEGEVCLDMTGLPGSTWKGKLSDLREEILHYRGIDPKKTPITVEPGIHYFMGGILVDRFHRTNLAGLFAAGECTSQYHGANRLGGNSMLGALYGGQVAAKTAASEALPEGKCTPVTEEDALTKPVSPIFARELGEILSGGLSIVRTEESMESALKKLGSLAPENEREENRRYLAQAMVRAALSRKESRGAHYREDFPEAREEERLPTIAVFEGGSCQRILREEIGR